MLEPGNLPQMNALVSGGHNISRRSPSESDRVSPIKFPLEPLFRIDPPYTPNRGPRPRVALDDQYQVRRSDPLVRQSPGLEMSYPLVHFPLDEIHVAQRCSSGPKLHQKRRRGPPVSNSNAFYDQVGTAFQRVVLDDPEQNGARERCVISASLLFNQME